MKEIIHALIVGISAWLLTTCQTVDVATKMVVLDIGRQHNAGGAHSPDKKINEFRFWSRYAPYVKDGVEKAGYACVITNRGISPAKEEKGVIYMNLPDKNALRYPSRYFPAHIGAGMVCVDYVIDISTGE